MPTPEQVSAEQRRRLLLRELAIVDQVSAAYEEILLAVEAELDDLFTRMEAARATGRPLSTSVLFERDRLLLIEQDIVNRINVLANRMTSNLTLEQLRAARLGVVDATDLIAASLGPEPVPGLLGVYSRLNVGAAEAIIAATTSESNLARLLSTLGTDAAARVRSRLIEGVALGRGPRETARLIREAFGGNRTRALTIARTECLPGETLVDAAVVDAIYRRWYEGPMVKIVTGDGREFSATPNHPMLTRRGWVPAGQITEGDDLVGHDGQQYTGSTSNQDVQAPPATLREIFDALAAIGVAERRRTSDPDFHGDGREGYVDVFTPTRALRIGSFAPFYEPVMKDLLSPSDFARTGFCHDCTRLLPVDQTPCRCFGSEGNVGIPQAVANEAARYTEPGCNIEQRFPVEVIVHNRFGVDVRPVLVMSRAAVFLDERLENLGRGANYTSSVEPTADSPFASTDRYGDLFHGQPGRIQPDGVAGPRVIRDRSDRATHARLFEYSPHPQSVDSERGSDLAIGQPRGVKTYRVRRVDIRQWSGHVYNLSTPYGYFTINGGACTGNTLRAYRDSTLANYRENSRTVTGWRWSAARSTRTCPVCWALDGREFPLETPFASHPACRCSAQPLVRSFGALLGRPDLDGPVVRRETGPERFAQLSTADQRLILGPGKYAAYRDGRITLEDLVGEEIHPLWGPVRFERSLRAVLGVPVARRRAS